LTLVGIPGKGAPVKAQKQRTPPAEPTETIVATDEAIDDATGAITFASLGLDKAVLDVLAQLGFAQPTPIQVAAIPPLLAGKDVVGRARTGTGKTAAFGLPLLSRLSSRSTGRPRGLVLAPTRELALQVTEALKTLAARPLRIVTVYGGAPYGPQLRALRDGVEVVVGTPGRIIDLMEREALDLSELEMLVLDEADEMLKMGFIEEVEKILEVTPTTRQVALFSATMPDQIRRVADRWLKDAVQCADAKGVAVAEIEQCYVQVPGRNKREALVRVLQGEPRTAAIVFAATKIQCDEVAWMLSQSGFQAEALHGDLSQPAREKVVQQLRDRRLDLVVATDIAARGIDIDHLSLIINLDLPKNVEIYTHRIGRTGRAGRKGKAITFVVPRESLNFVQALGRQGTTVTELFLPSEKVLVERRREALANEALNWLAADDSDGSEQDVAKRWVKSLVESGVAIEDIAAAALGGLALHRSVSLEGQLDAGLPPWARQPNPVGPPKKAAPRQDAANNSPYSAAVQKMAPVSPKPAPVPHKVAPAHKTAPAPRAEQYEAIEAPPAPAPKAKPPYVAPPVIEVAPAHKPKAPHKAAAAKPESPYKSAKSVPPEVVKKPRAAKAAPMYEAPQSPTSPEPGAEAWVVVGVGRNEGVRPSDIVGALANELGIPGASIGRIEVRDQSTLVQVVPEFAERLGTESWPLQVRRIDTEVKCHAAPGRARRLPEPPQRPTYRGARAPEAYDDRDRRADRPTGTRPAPRPGARKEAPARPTRAPASARPSAGDRPPRRGAAR
jgi:ATP-dependent RNA helicase DeaD